jgi:Condensation domain
VRGVADRVVAERILVPFDGEGSGTGELSWGQKTAWRGVLMRGGTIWLVGVYPVPAGKTVDDLAADLAFLVSRHQALRTRLLVRGNDDVQQVVASSGEIWLDVVDAQDDEDPYKVAEAVEESYDAYDRDYANDWPVRWTVVRHRGVLAYRVVAMCHTSVDGFATLTINSDLVRRDSEAGAAMAPVTAMSALEQARLQTSPAGQRRSAAVERHWERVLRTIPPRRFPESVDKREPRYGYVDFSSRALYLAIQAVAARTEHDTSPVLLAAFAAGLARISGINPAVPRLMVHNRFRPRLGDSVSPLSQTCPCVIDIADMTFDEAVRRTYHASLSAFKNAYFEPVRIREILAAVSQERGEEVDVNLLYNDRRSTGSDGEAGESAGMGRGVTGSLPTQEEVQAALPLTTMSWEESDDPLDAFHVHIIPATDVIRILVFFDTHYVALTDTEAVLRHMEAVAVGAAFNPSEPAGV